MGCACGGKKSGSPSRLAGQVRGVEPGVKWEWVKDGKVVDTFAAKWQAEHAVNLAGGRFRRVTSSPDQAQEN